jgi:hypothetical protein
VPILSAQDREHFQRLGFVVLHGIVPEVLLAAADAEIVDFIRGERPRDVHEVHAPVVVGDERAPGQPVVPARRPPEGLRPSAASVQRPSTLLDPPATSATPLEVRGRRGDVVLAHHLLGHNRGGNTASITRRTISYRLAATAHRARWAASVADPWLEYPALRPSVRS